MPEDQDRPLPASTLAAAAGPVETPRRHGVSGWYYVVGVIAFLLGCYLLYLEDSTMVRTVLPATAPRTILPDASPRRIQTATVLGTSTPPAQSPQRFGTDFLDSIWRDALIAGVKRTTFERALPPTLSPDPEVLALSASQPEFDRTTGDYISTVVSTERIAAGRAMLEQHAPLLDAIERRYGVDRHILLAIWGIETNYGQTKGDRSVVRSLATLASADQRRSAFWRSELMSALLIADQDRIALDRLVGSWAGAMGHTQFMPSTYLKHAVDFDGDGVRDVWASVPDALSSSARYLQASGWIQGRVWGKEVVLPQDFDFTLATPAAARSLAAWRILGLRAQVGVLPADEGTNWQVVVPAGAGGPAFLVSQNFDALLNYNHAYAYALAVGVLADRIAGLSGVVAAWPATDLPMSRDQRIELQEVLVSLGYDTGGIDGILGTKTREAIRGFQRTKGLPTDGHPSIGLLNRIRSERRL